MTQMIRQVVPKGESKVSMVNMTLILHGSHNDEIMYSWRKVQVKM
jgi:hypothetical protein